MVSDTAAVNRIRAEYLEMPGLSLTVDQLRRLCGIDRATCEMALRALVDAKFLSVRPDATYARSSDGSTALPRRERLQALAGRYAKTR